MLLLLKTFFIEVIVNKLVTSKDIVSFASQTPLVFDYDAYVSNGTATAQ